MKIYTITVAVAVALLVITVAAARRAPASITFPTGYRQWTHVRTGLIGPNNPMAKFVGGFHHIYANDLAVQGYATGHFPQGAVLVFDVLAAQELSGDYTEGARRHVDVMVRDTVLYKNTGGWGYQEFKGNTQTPSLSEAVQKNCYNCHRQTATHVMSEMRE